MPPSAIPWAVGALVALAGGIVVLVRRRAAARSLTEIGLVAPGMVLLAAAAGVGWRAWEARAWPGPSPADAFALLAGGALVVVVWLERSGRLVVPDATRCFALGLTLIGTAVLLGTAAILADGWPALPVAAPTRAWLLGLRSLLAGVGLGAWLPALATSGQWFGQTLTGRAAAGPAQGTGDDIEAGAPQPTRLETINPAEDPGRLAALASLPWLTAACLASGAWNMITHAAIGRAVPADLWLLAAWLLGGAYLHLTSSWRPLRLPGWLSPVVAAVTFSAGVLAASTAGSLR